MRYHAGGVGRLGLILLLGLAGCQPPLPPPAGEGGLPTLTVPLPADAQPAVDAARADLARRLGVDAAAITLASVAATTWPSVAALGCPGAQPVAWRVAQPVPGYIITLQHAGQDYIYHAGGGQVVYCDPLVMNPP